MQTHRIELDGVTQCFHVAGSGTPCIVHPGGPGLGWEYLRMPLLEQRLRLVYVEPIGTGRSGRLGDARGYNIERYARQVLGIVEHLGCSRAHLLGHSFGGFVAQRFALEYPERVASLSLYSTSPVTGTEFIADAAANLARIARANGDERLRAAFEAIWSSGDDATFTRYFREIFPAYFADYRRQAAELEPIRAALVASWAPMCGQSPRGHFDVRSELGNIRAPSLVVIGEHDYICGPRWGDLLVRGLRGAARVSFERSGHMAHLEEPEAFADAIASFVTQHASD